MNITQELQRIAEQDTDLGVPGHTAQVCTWAVAHIEHLETELAAAKAMLDQAVRLAAERL